MRLIDADTLKAEFTGNFHEMWHYTGIRAFIDVAPTIDAEPVRHGHWIDAYPYIEPNPMFMYGICSACGCEQSISNKLNYCPNCGAKMDNGG